MTTHRYVYMLCLAPLLALWLPQTAQAQRPDDQVPRHRHGKPAPHTDSTPHHQQRLHPNRPATDMPHPMLVPSPAVGIQIGRYFQSQHLEAAKNTTAGPRTRGFAPPAWPKRILAACLPDKPSSGARVRNCPQVWLFTTCPDRWLSHWVCHRRAPNMSELHRISC